MSDPYGVPPEIGPMGGNRPGPGYGPPPGGPSYGPPGGGPGYPGPLPPVPDRSSIQTSSILLIVAGFLCGTLIPAIFGIIALTELDKNPESARKLNRIGWICAIVILAFIVLALLISFALPVLFAILAFLGIAASSSSGSGLVGLVGLVG